MKANYTCTQAELYTIARLGWTSCSEHLAQFTSFSPRYIASYVTDQLDAIEITRQMPDESQRIETQRIQHTQLLKDAASLCDLYQRLKRYILKAYHPSQQEIMLNSAGQPYFEQARSNNWDAASQLANNMVTFIDTHDTQLINNDNMPPTFVGIITSVATSFTTLHNDYLNSRETANIETQAKITANNAIYASLIAMFLDGQEIFRDNPTVRNQFIFEHCLLLVRGAGTAGVRGTVTDSVTTLPIQGATITLGVNDYTTQSVIDGHYEISPAAAGTYTVNVTTPGYQPLTIPSHQILTGTISTLNLLLNPEP